MRHISDQQRTTERVWAGCALVGWVLAGGCRPAPSANPQPLVVLISGDTAGRIAPCGCASRQSGGLLRRASYVAQSRRQAAVLVADVGGAVGGNSLYERLKLEAILEGERAMGVCAHNLGAGEAAQDADFLDRLIRSGKVPLVSANLRTPDGRLLAEPLRLLSAAGRRVAVTGVLSPRYAAGRWRIDPPQQAVLEALRPAAGRFDHLVVLAYLPLNELRELAAALPEADIVCGGPTGQPVAPEPCGPALLASATNQGKFLARFEIPAGAGRWTGRIVELDDRIADDPQQLENLRRLREELARRDLTPDQAGFRALAITDPPPGYRIAGGESCLPCHPEDCQAWEKSGHGRAWAALDGSRAQADPACQLCHTTGYALPGGFASLGRTPQRVGVGCESCHGPSQAHAGDPKLPTAYAGRAKDQCPVCHDAENSPKFAYAEYWAKIRHGRAAHAPAKSPAERPASEARR